MAPPLLIGVTNNGNNAPTKRGTHHGNFKIQRKATDHSPDQKTINQ